MHSVSGKRIGYCTEHGRPMLSKKQEEDLKKKEDREKNLSLF
jgi:hypothetical protein